MTENSKTVTELALLVSGRVVGDGNILIHRVAGIETASEGDISFLDDLRAFDRANESLASCIIVPIDAPDLTEKSVIHVAHPKQAFALIAEVLHPGKVRPSGIHSTAVIAATAHLDETVFVDTYVHIGESTRIGAGTHLLHGTSIGDAVMIGRDCVIHPNAVIYDGVTLGDRVILHAGVVVGADGFGYVPDETNILHKFPQIGTVVIEDDVEIGAGTCIDRGSLGVTRIGRGTKIDNLVQIAHNVQIGERVVIAAQTGISGSTVIEDDVVIGGQVGLGDHAVVQSGAIIGSKAGILPGKIVRKGVWWGVPVQPLDDYKRLNAHKNRLPQLREEVKELQRRIAELEKGKNDNK